MAEKIVQTAGRDSWAAFTQAKEVWGGEEGTSISGKEAFQREIFFPICEPNDAFAAYFTGQSYLAEVSNQQGPCTTSPLSPAAATTGTSTVLAAGAARC